MNKHKFVEYLRSPKDLDKETMTELEAVIQDHPYFMSARTLLAKAGKNLKSKNAKSYVASAAVYATDRGLLKRYINDELIFLNPMAVHESHEAELGRDLEKAVKTNRIAAAKTKQSSNQQPTAGKKKPIKKSVKPKSDQSLEGYLTMDDLKSESPSELDNIIAELYKDMEELKVNREKLKHIEDQLAEEEAVDEAVKKATNKPKEESEPSIPESSNSKPSLDETSSDTVEEPPKKKEETIKKASESRSARISRINQEVEISKSLTGATRISKAPVEKKDAQPADNKKKATTKKATVKKSTSSRKSKTSKKAGEEAKKPDSPDKKDDKGDPHRKSQNEIIDQFIKNNPSITPAQSKENDPKTHFDLSNNSTELHPDIASEYLAEIYLEQGRKERAIQIYEALIVRFPEKSLYFADIIKKLNESS